ncbi:hypothetical protein AAFF_G00041940 [Aldrovandia affinis]|uniref:Uncharacterized protein n=1 Tax=Aldrovandia affinis TaxID=143900 RepID=A0AAD7S2K9_9TELE|nr:hypothetical protein AAFF_G00041940 [Aldrovandia affinis]
MISHVNVFYVACTTFATGQAAARHSAILIALLAAPQSAAEVKPQYPLCPTISQLGLWQRHLRLSGRKQLRVNHSPNSGPFSGGRRGLNVAHGKQEL